MLIITGCNEVVAKAMFLLVCVILFTWGVCLSACWDTTTSLEADPPGADTPPRSRHPPRSRTPQKQNPPGADTPPEAAGMHPTGMHSWFNLILLSQSGVRL